MASRGKTKTREIFVPFHASKLMATTVSNDKMFFRFLFLSSSAEKPSHWTRCLPAENNNNLRS